MFVATLQQAHYKFFHDDDDDMQSLHISRQTSLLSRYTQLVSCCQEMLKNPIGIT